MFPKMKLWGAATVGSKGQVVIPAEARAALSLKEGDKLMVMGNASRGGVVFIKADAVETMMQAAQTDIDEMRKDAHDAETESI